LRQVVDSVLEQAEQGSREGRNFHGKKPEKSVASFADFP
jgi:hypothetical protein